MDKQKTKYLNLLLKLCIAAKDCEEAEGAFAYMPTMDNRIRIVQTTAIYEKIFNKIVKECDPPANLDEIVKSGYSFVNMALEESGDEA